MKKKDVVSAWRDQDAFESLSAEEQAAMPSHPAGAAQLDDDELTDVAGGGAGTHYSHCEPTASWCEDCGSGGGTEILGRA